jgi:hypothetical protein
VLVKQALFYCNVNRIYGIIRRYIVICAWCFLEVYAIKNRD